MVPRASRLRVMAPSGAAIDGCANCIVEEGRHRRLTAFGEAVNAGDVIGLPSAAFVAPTASPRKRADGFPKKAGKGGAEVPACPYRRYRTSERCPQELPSRAVAGPPMAIGRRFTMAIPAAWILLTASSPPLSMRGMARNRKGPPGAFKANPRCTTASQRIRKPLVFRDFRPVIKCQSPATLRVRVGTTCTSTARSTPRDSSPGPLVGFP